MTKLLSIIIPNYNEEENLKRGVLDTIRTYLESQAYEWEVLISDDGSTDKSIEILTKYTKKHKNFYLIKNKHAGKPYALRSAILRSKSQYVLFTDMDQSSPIQELEKLLPWTKKGYNVVIGSRGRRRNATWYRQIISVGFWFIRKLIILPDIIDTQAGFKVIDREIVQKIFSKMRIFGRKNEAKGWKVTAYDVEMLHLAKKMGNKIMEVPVVWKDEDVSSNKDRNFFRESYEMLFEIMRVRINDMLGKYA